MFFKNLAELLLPLNEQLKDLNNKLTEVAQKAEGTWVLWQLPVRGLKSYNQKLLLLDISSQQLNIKISRNRERKRGKKCPENGTLQFCIVLGVIQIFETSRE